MTSIVNVKLDDGASAPSKAHINDVGYDLRALKVTLSERTYTNTAGESIPCVIKVVTGVHIQPKCKIWTMLAANSRIGDHPFVLANGIGVIDPGYTGSVNLKFKTLPWATKKDIEDYFGIGNVVGQLCIMPYVESALSIVNELESTERGAGGFGSTAAKMS